jgi:hypothetical protein
MLTRLNKSRRLKAGWCIALAYLFCALAPSLSFAFADGSMSAPCIIEDHGPGMHRHLHGSTDRHQHDASGVHGHSQGAAILADQAVPEKAPQKTADTRCCGLISVSAIPAGEIVVIRPTALTSLCETESTRVVADNTPPRLYRPPIS